jgi:hypothetical protein
MIILISLEPSNIKNKKWTAVFKSNTYYHKTVHFGDSRYKDFTQHKDKKRMELYRKRHQHDNLDDPTSSGALSYFILWSKPDFREGLINYLEQFQLGISPTVKNMFNV